MKYKLTIHKLIICHGLDLINPHYFLPVTVLICSIMSLATGTSYGSAGSGGLAMMGIGIAMGFPPGMIAGAVICGALFDFVLALVRLQQPDGSGALLTGRLVARADAEPHAQARRAQTRHGLGDHWTSPPK